MLLGPSGPCSFPHSHPLAHEGVLHAGTVEARGDHLEEGAHGPVPADEVVSIVGQLERPVLPWALLGPVLLQAAQDCGASVNKAPLPANAVAPVPSAQVAHLDPPAPLDESVAEQGRHEDASMHP